MKENAKIVVESLSNLPVSTLRTGRSDELRRKCLRAYIPTSFHNGSQRWFLTTIDVPDDSLNTMHLVPFSKSISIARPWCNTENAYIVWVISRTNLYGDVLPRSVGTMSRHYNEQRRIEHAVQSRLSQVGGMDDVDVHLKLMVGKMILKRAPGSKTGTASASSSDARLLEWSFASNLDAKYLHVLKGRLTSLGFSCVQYGYVDDYMSIHVQQGMEHGRLIRANLKFARNNKYESDDGYGTTSDSGSDDTRDPDITVMEREYVENIDTVGTRTVDVRGLLSFPRKEAKEKWLTNQQIECLRKCYEEDNLHLDVELPNLRFSIIHRVSGIYTWVKVVHTADGKTTKLTVRANVSTTQGIRCVDVGESFLNVKLSLDEERGNVSGKSLAAEYRLLREWAYDIFTPDN